MGFHFEQTVSFADFQDDFWYWHCGRSHYAVWVIQVIDRAIEERVGLVHRQLSDVLLPDYARQLHVTLTVCGFPSVFRRYADDFLPADLGKQENDLNRAKVGPFTIEIDRVDSFAGAPFLRVIDSERGIAKLRACLGATSLEQVGFCYQPHLTIGLYGRSVVKKSLLDSLGRVMPSVPLRYQVNTIHWVRYDARVVGGPLQDIAEYSLQKNCLYWKTDAPFEAVSVQKN